MYQLKKGVSDFTVVDGVYAGRRYVRGTVYAEVPPQEIRKFINLTYPAPAQELIMPAWMNQPKPETARRRKKAMFPQNKEE